MSSFSSSWAEYYFFLFNNVKYIPVKGQERKKGETILCLDMVSSNVRYSTYENRRFLPSVVTE
jgi:hypothetical protein